MSDREIPFPVSDRKTVFELLLEVAEQCARFDSASATLLAKVPTERGELIANVRIEIVQPLPRTH